MRNHLRIARSRRGFTLIEIMVVVVVLGILAAMVVTSFMGKTDDAMVSAARGDVSSLMSAVQVFRLDMKRVPTQEEGLAVLRTPPSSEDANLWKGPYLQKDVPTDPWGVPYQYYAPAPNDVDEFGIASFGSDKSAGGEGNARDINSWEDYNTPAGEAGATGAGAPAAPAAPPPAK